MNVIVYECDEHGQLYSCEVDESGSRVCPECGRHVEIGSDGGAV